METFVHATSTGEFIMEYDDSQFCIRLAADYSNGLGENAVFLVTVPFYLTLNFTVLKQMINELIAIDNFSEDVLDSLLVEDNDLHYYINIEETFVIEKFNDVALIFVDTRAVRPIVVQQSELSDFFLTFQTFIQNVIKKLEGFTNEQI